MGFHVSLFLLDDGDAQAFLRLVGLRESGRDDPSNDSRFSVAHQNGRCLVWMNWHNGMPEEKDFARFSESVPFLNLDIAESATMAVCRHWRAGGENWVLAHDGSHDGGLDISGDLPPEAAAIIAACKDAQAAETGPVDHLFDAPVALFEALGGIRHDTVHDLTFRVAEPLAKVGAEMPRSWWRFW